MLADGNGEEEVKPEAGKQKMLAPERFLVWVPQLHPSNQRPLENSPQDQPRGSEGPSTTCQLFPPLSTRGTAIPTSVNNPLPQDSYGQDTAPPPTTYVRRVTSLGYTPPAVGGWGWAGNPAFQMCLATPTRKDTGDGRDRRRHG